MLSKALVVGSSGGIGQALSLELSLRNFQLTTISRQAVDMHGQSRHIVAHYEDEASLEKAAETIDAELDLIFFATGFLHDQDYTPEKSYKEFQSKHFEKAIWINALGPILLAKHLLKKISRNQECKIAFLSARVGSISDNRLGGWYSYRASKAALNMLVKTLSIDLKRTHPQITVIALHPGTVDTSLSKPFQNNLKTNQLFSPQDCAKKLVDVTASRQPSDSGFLFDWAGKTIEP